MSRLIEAIERGEITEIFPVLDVIETQSAKVFLTDERAYKIYKRENHYFGDFGNEEYWRTFLRDDMHWNMTLAPEVYLEFRGMAFDGSWHGVDIDCADDVLIVMSRVTSPSLTSLLRDGTVDLEQLTKTVHLMTARVDALTQFVATERYPWKVSGWKKIFLDLLGDVYAWAPHADPAVPKEWSFSVADALIRSVNALEYFADFPETSLAAAVDCHSDNIFFLDRAPAFLDSMLPKEGWRLVDPFCNTAKFAVDVTAYYGTSARDALYSTYSEHHHLPPADVRVLYEVCYALLKCIYVGILGPQDAVARYKAIVDKNLTMVH